MRFLNGSKTVIGVLGTTAIAVLTKVVPEVVELGQHAFGVAEGVFGLLTVLGVIHKFEKTRIGTTRASRAARPD